ncbi:unnamed protein product, partial [Pylaiella littoralis]
MGKPRPGAEAAQRLLESGTRQEWDSAAHSYTRIVERLSQEKGKGDLVELDRWWREDLPKTLRARGAGGGKPFLVKDELVDVVRWKLLVGQMRATLLPFAKSTNPATVKAKSREAFEHLSGYYPRSSPSSPSAPSSPSSSLCHAATSASMRVPEETVKLAVKTLEKDLKGVGPATASAVLAALCGGCPFLADEVIEAVKGLGNRDYTIKTYLQVHDALAEKAKTLGTPWDAERVRKALWSRAMHARFDLPLPLPPPPPPPPAAAAAAAAAGKSLLSPTTPPPPPASPAP